MSHRLAEAWLCAPSPACPTPSAATPGGRPSQKTMNLHLRNVPWLFGERGQNLGRIRASPAAPTRRSRSPTQKWTISRTLRWVSGAHFSIFISTSLFVCSSCPRLLFKKGVNPWAGRAAVGWIVVGAGDEALIGGRKWKWRVLPSLFGSKLGSVPPQKRLRPSD